jgi:DNA polymerase III subunit alpha
VRPTELNDLVALNALYRPGALDQIPVYAKGKHDPGSIVYADERLKPILESSNGVILYQEQAMQIAKELAGFSGAKADDLRKAIGKKNRQAMASLKDEFYAGCRASGTSEKVVEFLWQTNEKSADYSFNKSHAACYGLIAYRTAWLKANHPAEYMAALISSVMSTKDKVPFFVARCEEMGIEILAPDVNLSDHEFTVVDGNVRFGLDAVKGVGHQAVEAIKRARGDSKPTQPAPIQPVPTHPAQTTPVTHAHPMPGRPFSSIWDFCARVDARAVNKKAIEALIKCGAFGSTGASRKGMLSVLEQAQAAGQKAQQDAQIGQGSIFDLQEDSQPRDSGGSAQGSPLAALARPAHPPIPAEELDHAELLAAEKEAIGLFVSAHPLKPLRAALKARIDCSIAELAERRDKDWVTVGGIIAETKRIKTRNGDPMMFATLDDLEGSVEMLIFGKALAEHEAALSADKVVLVRGRVDHKEAGKTALIVQSVEEFEPDEQQIASANARERAPEGAAPGHPMRLRVDLSRLTAVAIEDLKHLLEDFPGPSEVLLELRSSAGASTLLRLGEAYRVRHTAALRAEAEQALAPATLTAVAA